MALLLSLQEVDVAQAVGLTRAKDLTTSMLLKPCMAALSAQQLAFCLVGTPYFKTSSDVTLIGVNVLLVAKSKVASSSGIYRTELSKAAGELETTMQERLLTLMELCETLNSLVHATNQNDCRPR